MTMTIGVCGWQNDFGSVYCSVLQKNCGFRFGFGFFSVRLCLDPSVDVDAIFDLRFYGMTLEMTYFRAELVQLIVSLSDSELVQRYMMKTNTLTVDPIMLQDKL